jgi:hypothetical protein
MTISLSGGKSARPTKAPLSHQEPSTRSVAEWATEINSVWQLGAARSLELAAVVYQARCKLSYGVWTQLWRSSRIDFSKRKGEMLVVIGGKLNNLDAQTSAHLPSGWNTLYHLARLDRATLEAAIEAGAIHPGMRLRQAKELLAKFRGQAAASRSRKPNIKLRLQKFADFVSSTCPDWSPEEREVARDELARLANEVGAVCGQRPLRSGLVESSMLSNGISFSG